MLTTLRIDNFKCFDAVSLPLAPLTLLTGFNAGGKSTALQGLLLLAQALRLGGRSDEVPLNGPLTRLGTLGEVLSSGSGDLVFAIEDDRAGVEWEFQSDRETAGRAVRIRCLRTKTVEGSHYYEGISLSKKLLPPSVHPDVEGLIKRLRTTVFLSAVRMGTADVFPFPEDPSPVHADVGVQGEYAPWWFDRFLDDEIEYSRCNLSDQAVTLRRQFNAWADELFPGAQGNAQTIEKTNLLRLEMRIGSTDAWRRPSNIGYGLTYAFPIIVAGLLANSGQILIIDSPEAHLHPMGQSKMGLFLAKIAAAGVQVIVETHSDHVLTGIRLAVQDKTISPRKVAVHFFNHPGIVATGLARVVSPLIDPHGNLSEWPEGFFDQSEKDLARLAGWK